MASNVEPNKIIDSMVGVSKYHGKKQVLKDIYLSYFTARRSRRRSRVRAPSAPPK
jgi:hypothetical protein